MLLICYCCGIRSERQQCADVHLNLAYRWFCGLGVRQVAADGWHLQPLGLHLRPRTRPLHLPGREGVAAPPAPVHAAADWRRCRRPRALPCHQARLQRLRAEAPLLPEPASPEPAALDPRVRTGHGLEYCEDRGGRGLTVAAEEGRDAVRLQMVPVMSSASPLPRRTFASSSSWSRCRRQHLADDAARSGQSRHPPRTGAVRPEPIHKRLLQRDRLSFCPRLDGSAPERKRNVSRKCRSFSRQ